MSEIYFNGTILTMDETCPQVQAVFLEDGRIRRRGTDKEVLACKKEETVCIDLQGKTMLPGFIDGHSHFAGLANSLSQCDLSQAEDFEDIIRRLKAFIKENEIPEGQWVIGTNYDHNFLLENSHPDKRVLDKVSNRHPVLIIHASSHMGVTNSMGLRMQGLDQAVPDPEGGRYGRADGSRELSGYMEETAFVGFRGKMPMVDRDALMLLFRKAQEIYASYGVTTVQEGMVTEPLFRILQYAEQQHALYLDLAGYIDLENHEDLLTRHEEYADHYRNHFKIGGYKIFLDGSPQGRTAWMKEPYAGAEDGYCGYPIKKDGEVYRLIRKALKNHRQLLAHCNGDAAAEQYITQFEKVRSDFPAADTHRPVMIHAQLVQEKQLERMAEISMIPSFFIAHTYYWGDIHIRNFGMARAANISPAGSASRLKLPFTLHQDSPVLMPDVFGTIWCGAKRITKAGVQLSKEERIGVYEGLKAMTVHGAYQYGEERDKGTIEEGKLADLIILDKNPLDIPVDEVKHIKVLETIKEGRIVYRRRS